MDISEQVDRIKEIVGKEPGTHHIEILHDAGCPALVTHRMADCTCQPEIRKMAERSERIKAALVRYEASGKAKPGKRKSVKLFSLDRDDRHETVKEKET